MRPTLQDVIERAWNEIANLPDNERPKVSTNQLSIELAREYERDGRTPQQREETLKADIETLLFAYEFALRKLPRYWNPEPLRHERAYNIMALCLRSMLTNLLALTYDMGLHLPQDEIQRYEGMELWVRDIKPFIVQTIGKKPHQSPSNDAGGQFQGNDRNKPLEAERMPINKDTLPTIGDKETKELEQRVFLKAIKAGFMSLKADNRGYTWKESIQDLAYICGRIYWGDNVIESKTKTMREQERRNDYTLKIYELEKTKKRLSKPERLKALFDVDVTNNRSMLKEPPPKWRKIDLLFSGLEAGN